MKRLQALEALLEEVQEGKWDFRADAPARQVFPYRSASADDLGLTAREAFEGSLDAAKALHEAVLPGWGYLVSSQQWIDVWRFDPASTGVPIRGINTNPARAWLIAILKALIVEEQAHDQHE